MLEELFLLIILFGGGLIIFLFLLNRQKGNLKEFEDFKTRPLSEFIKEIKLKVDKQGNKVKNATLMNGYHKIPYVDKFYTTKGKIPLIKYDRQKNTYEVDETITTLTDFIIFRVGSDNFILRFFGMNKEYYFIQKTDEKRIDYIPEKNYFKMPNMDFRIYGDIWIEDLTTVEYINNVAIMKMNEMIMTHIVNFPDRIVHLDSPQAKKLNLADKLTELEKRKYDNIKKGDEVQMS